MRQFLIHADNMERLEKKLATIFKKCAKTGIDFHYEKVGEEFVESKDTDGAKRIDKYIKVDVEGTMIYQNWEFVATLEHHDVGNVVRAFNTELVVPDRYRTCGPVCEHCKRIRSRKDTYILYNHETGEFKQVGKSCIQEFTNGLDAEQAALFISCYEQMESAYTCGSGWTKYYDLKEILSYSFECVRHFGYEKFVRDEYEVVPRRSTRERVMDYMEYFNHQTSLWSREYRAKVEDELETIGFNADSPVTMENVAAALAWIRDSNNADCEYLRNLHVVCSEDYIDYRDLGIAISLPVAYNNYVKKLERDKKRNEEFAARHNTEMASEFQGNVKDRLTIDCESFTFIKAFDSMYGTSFLYKFMDTNGNVYTWFSSNPIDEMVKVKRIIGTVKEHKEYGGIKQTVMTRCKVLEVG